MHFPLTCRALLSSSCCPSHHHHLGYHLSSQDPRHFFNLGKANILIFS